jgi:nucleotide-binding universal stress UspA family protein
LEAIEMKILIATDGSDFSKAAIEECCRYVIRPERDKVLIVSACEDAYPIAAEPFAISAEYYQKLEDAIVQQSGNYVDDALAIVRKQFADSELTVSTEVLRGAPDQQIVEKSKEWGADLIVVGSHGRGFWGRLLGSVSNGVVHHAPCSVLVVRK